MQKIIIKIICVVCTLFCFSCQSSDNENNLLIEMEINGEQLSSLNLKGSKWKLAGLYHSETDILRIIEPLDCKECYTFTFTSNTKAKGNILIDGFYDLELSENSIRIYGDDVGICGFFGMYQNWIRRVTSYSISKTEFKLFTFDFDGFDNNYLLFKPF